MFFTLSSPIFPIIDLDLPRLQGIADNMGQKGEKSPQRRTGNPFPKGRQASDADIAAVRALVGAP